MRMYSDIIAYGVVRSLHLWVSFRYRQKTRLGGVLLEGEGGEKSTVTSMVSYDKLGLCKIGLMGLQEALLSQPKSFQAC